jgi:hypothetical protein
MSDGHPPHARMQNGDLTSVPNSAPCQACTHISETLFYLNYYSAPDGGPHPLFLASGPEDPRQWARHLQIKWRGPDTVEVATDPAIHFQDRRYKYESVHILYVPLRRAGV